MSEKIRFKKGAAVGQVVSYPMIELPKKKCRFVSPRIGDRQCIENPLMPEDDGFIEELFEVVQVRDDVLNDKWPGWFFEKHGVQAEIPVALVIVAGFYNIQLLDEDLNPKPKEAARLVHMDNFMDLGVGLLDHLLMSDYQFRNKPTHGGVEFLDGQVDHQAGLAMELSKSAEEAFKAKWFFGRPRPEEILGFNCTEYKEASPCHPAYPAGHGCFAGSTYRFLNQYLKLDRGVAQTMEIATKHFAMYRTLAGVHYQSDNVAGWELGAKRKW